jgi:hypothetical protein
MDYKLIIKILIVFIVILIGVLLHESTHFKVFTYGCTGVPHSAYMGFAVKVDDLSTCQDWVMPVQAIAEILDTTIAIPLEILLILIIFKRIEDDE